MARNSEAVKKFLDLTITRGNVYPIAGPDYVIVWDLPNGAGWDYMTYFHADSPWRHAGELAPETHAEVWERCEDTGWQLMAKRP